MLTIATALLTESLIGLVPSALLVAVAVSFSGVWVSALKFIAFATMPILIALLLVWGVIMDPSDVPAPHRTGFAYALYFWLRVVVCGGALQFLLIPLIEHPANLKDFLDRTGLGGALGTLIISSLVFIPETRRRLAQVIDARRAQGHQVSGLNGLRALPTLLMPVVASLLESSVNRAEVWAHRGVLSRRNKLVIEDTYYSRVQGAVSLTLVLAVVASGKLT